MNVSSVFENSLFRAIEYRSSIEVRFQPFSRSPVGLSSEEPQQIQVLPLTVAGVKRIGGGWRQYGRQNQHGFRSDSLEI